ncbi:3'-to-5' exoribonuclease RNase R, partial [hydrothermal vent metagenome]
MKNIDQQILQYLGNPDYKPMKSNLLAGRLKVRKKEMPKFRKALERLIATGIVHEGKKGRLRAKTKEGTMEGIMKRTGSGAGYVIPLDAIAGDRTNDVYISHRDVSDAHTGDEVLVQYLSRRRSGGQRSGKVKEVLVRATNSFVGTYYEEDSRGYVKVDGKTLTEPVSVGDPGAKGVQPGDKVVIEMLRFPMPYRPGEAVLVKALGPKGAPGVDELSIIHEFGLPQEFPDDVLEEASLQAEQFDETVPKDRTDLTKETIVTIDPVDARDFDDAISLKKNSKGHWVLGVHIADVAHFVPSGTLLDTEAKSRGTSIYLPGRVIPMLPEVISNGLASLQKGKVRYTKTVYIEMTAEGVPVHTEFVNSAIKVTQRFAYEEVMPIVKAPDIFKSKEVSLKVRKLLKDMYSLAMTLRKRRFASGALELSLPEVKLEFDKDNRVTGAHEADHDESHQMIEEFMLAANVAVAREFSDRDIVFLRRAHGEPDYRKLKLFSEFIKALGYEIENFQSKTDLQELLFKAQGAPAERAISFALLRSFKQAEYVATKMGHYALSEDDYCHFTSPIRRYPDLTIHRIFNEIVSEKTKKPGLGTAETTRLGVVCSNLERRAQSAERELTTIKLLTYMQEHIGEEMEVVITGVEQFGLFCRGIELPAEGMIHISTLDSQEFFDYEQSTFSLVGRRRGRRYQLGNHIQVKIVSVDIDRRELSFCLTEEEQQKGE